MAITPEKMAIANRLRALQNEIITLAEQQGYNESIRVSTEMPAEITLWRLYSTIFPEWEPELEGVLAQLRQEASR